MNPIRPNGPSFAPQMTPQGGPTPDATRAAAQKAFFDAAMGRTSVPQAPAPAAPRPVAQTTFAVAPQRAQIRPAQGADAPARLLRPGSLLDIRI